MALVPFAPDKRWIAGLAVVLAVLVMSCAIQLPFPGGGTGYATVAQNTSPDLFVVQTTDDLETRYYAVPSGAEVVVDTVGEGNRPANAIAVLDGTCSLVERLEMDFSQGGTITILAGGNTDFTANRKQSADERAGAKTSCEATL